MCSTERQQHTVHMVKMTWGWENNDQIFIFGCTIALLLFLQKHIITKMYILLKNFLIRAAYFQTSCLVLYKLIFWIIKLQKCTFVFHRKTTTTTYGVETTWGQANHPYRPPTFWKKFQRTFMCLRHHQGKGLTDRLCVW